MQADIKTKLIVLNRIFDVYENFTKSEKKACKKGCSSCCTRNVTLTTLEGLNIFNEIDNEKKTAILSSVKAEIDKKRFIPEITINHMAKLCMEGKEIPDEENDPLWGKCPLLIDNQCAIYELRPFACRCMVSKSSCAESGFADMDDFTITLNNVFMQYLEHIDIGGYSGNLSDILLMTGADEDTDDCKLSNYFVENHGIAMLMVPPEHREKIRPVIEALQKI